MVRLSRRLIGLSAAVAVCAAVPAVVVTHAAAASGASVCSGTLSAPGTLAGSYESVVVRGACMVVGSGATVTDDVTVTAGSTLAAANGGAPLDVGGNLLVEKGAVVVMGCDAESPCFNNSTQVTGAHVTGNLVMNSALAAIVHEGSIGGHVSDQGGGGGSTCATMPGVFQLIQAPVFSAFENVSIGGNVDISNVHSCWLGLARDSIAGSVSLAGNNFADKDAIEVLANQIGGSLSCVSNSHVWDNHELVQGKVFPRSAPENNTVLGGRSGQCDRSSPSTKGGPLGPPGSF